MDYVVWSLPLAAMTLSFYLIIDYYASRDINLQIVFRDASSIEPQKTQLIYKGIVVGVVEGVQLDTKSHGVIVRASLDREAKYLAAEGTRFKIIQPKVGFSGISGLETLLKGSYIKIEKGNTAEQAVKQKIKTQFSGITTDEEDEMHDATAFVLRAKNGKGLNVGMPIEYKGVKIGSVVAIDFEGLTIDGVYNYQDILVKVGIENKYADIINEQSSFWKRPAVNARVDLNGMNFEISSLEALFKGGILVETPNPDADPVLGGHEFSLHDKMPTKKYAEASKIFQLVTNDAESLQKNDPVFYRGIKTGSIQDVILKNDGRAVVRLRMDSQHKHLVRANTIFWRKSAVDSKLGWSGLSLRVSSLESLVRGGINFATPTNFGAEVEEGYSFTLQDNEPEGDWKNWKPQFPPKAKPTNLSYLYE